MKTVTIHKAKTTLSQLCAAVEAGEEVVLARGSKPIIKLVLIEKKGKRKPGRLKGKGRVGPEFFEPMTEEELQEWGS